MNCEGRERKGLQSNLRYYRNIYIEGFDRSMDTLSKDIQCPSRYLNRGPTK
jgi:hypothetical protein